MVINTGQRFVTVLLHWCEEEILWEIINNNNWNEFLFSFYSTFKTLSAAVPWETGLYTVNNLCTSHL